MPIENSKTAKKAPASLEEAIKQRLILSETGDVSPGDTIVPPWGTTDNWSVIVTLNEVGAWENPDVQNNDNALLHIVVNVDARADKRGWVVSAHNRFKGGNNSFATQRPKLSYLMVISGIQKGSK